MREREQRRLEMEKRREEEAAAKSRAQREETERKKEELKKKMAEEQLKSGNVVGSLELSLDGAIVMDASQDIVDKTIAKYLQAYELLTGEPLK